MPQRPNRSLQKRGKGDIGYETFLFDELSSFDDFLVPLGREWTVVPAGEFVL
jgi:hypothetical protein